MATSVFSGRRTSLRPSPLARRFDAVRTAAPDAVAVRSSERELTYAEVDARATALAEELAATGLRPGEVVLALLQQSPELVVAALAVAKAGFAMTAANPTTASITPEDVAERTAARAAIIHAGASAPAGLDVLQVDLDAAPTHHPETGPPGPADPLELGIVIHTSGTSGVPRAVMLESGALADTVTHPDLDLGPGDVIGLHSAVEFDASFFELWAGLTSGATLMPAVNIDELTALLARDALTGMLITTSLFHVLADAEAFRPAQQLRWVLVGGEELSPTHAAKLVEQVSGVRLRNCYGPTETTVISTWHEVDPDGESASDVRVPIGQPAFGKAIHVLDSELRPVADNESGEIYVVGGLGRGYAGAPAATAERFVPDPTRRGGRMYRTGDFASVTGGVLHFLGRTDRQVKVRGHRVDPGEVEALLRGHHAVSDVAVTPVKRRGGRVVLCAYVVLTDAGRVSTAHLRDWMTGRAPASQVPARFVVLDRLPLTGNGKTDHRALPVAFTERTVDVDFVEPRDEMEQMVADIWADTLGVEGVGIDDNFFEVGGDSLASVEILVRTNAELDLALTARDLVEHQSVRDIAESIRRSEEASA